MALSRRQRRWLGIAVALIALFTVGGFLIAPPILKAQLVKRLSLELGREVAIEKIRMNPYAFSLSIEGLAIKDRDGAPFVGWRRVYVNFDAGSFLAREWRFQQIAVEAPASRVIVNRDGSFNFSDLIAKFSPPGETSAPPVTVAPAKPAWPLRVASLVVKEAALDFADHSRSAAFSTQVGPLSFVLKDFHTARDEGAPYEFDATTEAGERLAWRGTVSAAPLGSRGEFALDGIKLAKYAPYYRDHVHFDLLAGSLDVGGRYELDLSGATPVAKLADGAIHLTGFKLGARGAQNSVIELDDLNVTGIAADLAKMSVVIGRVALTDGRVTAHRAADGVIDLVALLTPVAVPAAGATLPVASAGSPTAATPAKPDVRIAEFAVRKFALSFEDHATPRVALNRIDNAEFDAQNLTLADGAEIPIRVALAFPDQGFVKIGGTVVLSPTKANLEVEAGSVAFANVSPYLEPLLNLRIAQGTLSAKGRAQLALVPDAQPDISFQGDASIDRFTTVAGPDNSEFSSWSALSIHGIAFKSAPLSVGIDEIVWSDPAAHLIVNRDGSNNLASVLGATPTPPAPTAPPAAPVAPAPPVESSNIAVRKITVANGTFTFADHSVEPAVNTAIKQFGGTIAGLSSTNLARADVDLKAMVDGVGPIVIAGKLDPLGAKKFVDLKVDFKNVDLTPFSPYTGKYAGYQLARGKLFLDVAAKVDGEKVAMANVVTLNQFTFGAATNSPDATKLPVRLGVALLKDTDGKMVIDIPVEGSLGDPTFRIGRVVWRVIGNLLTKAATSPFSLLGAMFGGGGDELAYQDFAAGSSELAAENLPKLATLTKALTGRPGLNLEIAGSFDPASDSFALKQQFFAKQLRAQLWETRRATDPNLPPIEQMVVTADDETALIRKIYGEKFPPGTEFGAPLPVAPPPPPPAAPARRGFFGRVVDVVTFKARSEAQSLPAPPPVVPVPSDAAAAIAAGPTLEEMKLRLADAITITDDDLRQLGTARAQTVRGHFLQAQLAPDRLFLVNEPAAKGPRVLLQLQ